MKDSMNLCKDCKWRRRDFPLFWDSRFERCRNPRSYGIRRAEEMDFRWLINPPCYTAIERAPIFSAIDVCGPDGKFWEAR